LKDRKCNAIGFKTATATTVTTAATAVTTAATTADSEGDDDTAMIIIWVVVVVLLCLLCCIVFVQFMMKKKRDDERAGAKQATTKRTNATPPKKTKNTQAGPAVTNTMARQVVAWEAGDATKYKNAKQVFLSMRFNKGGPRKTEAAALLKALEKIGITCYLASPSTGKLNWHAC